MGIQELSKYWHHCQDILILQMIMGGHQFIGLHYMDMQKLSKSWLLWQTFLIFQIIREWDLLIMRHLKVIQKLLKSYPNSIAKVVKIAQVAKIAKIHSAQNKIQIYFNLASTDHHSKSNISILVANEYLIWKKMNSWLHFFKAAHSFKGLIFQLKMNLPHIMFNCTSLIKQLSPCYPQLIMYAQL